VTGTSAIAVNFN